MGKNSLTVDEVLDAFCEFEDNTAKVSDVKELIYEWRDYSHNGYKTKYSFDQTIQAIINRHCSESPKFGGQEYFRKLETSIYMVVNYYKYNVPTKSPTEIILQKFINSDSEDDENETSIRNLRAINIIKRDRKTVNALKMHYNNCCQICNTRLKIGEQKFYSEVHHLKPLGKPHEGPDVISNMIVVCPNCHVQLDFKSLKIELADINIIEPHSIDIEYINYQNKG